VNAYTVVEPHSDDAWLSLGGHIEGWVKAGQLVRIVTVFADADPEGKRWAEAARYARTVGAQWLGVGLAESGKGIATDWTPDVDPADLAGRLRVAEVGTVVYPLGIRHPEHKAVAACAPPGALRYVEQPYASKVRNGPEVTGLLAGRQVVSWQRPHSRKYRHADVFASQRRFWFHEADSMAGSPEVLVH
jgi:LmbE family N-acetylglucosaminyl deacetylase